MGPRRTRIEPIRYRYFRTFYQGRNIVRSPRAKWGLVALFLALYAANFVGGNRGLVRRVKLQAELKRITTANARLRVQKEQLLQEVRLKENDPFSLEKLAREKYWMVGPGETIYRFEDDEVVPDVPEDAEGPGVAEPQRGDAEAR